jgi:hypothetical protein
MAGEGEYHPPSLYDPLLIAYYARLEVAPETPPRKRKATAKMAQPKNVKKKFGRVFAGF